MGEEKTIKQEYDAQEEKKSVPKHLQKYKDPERRKEWMREYHRKYYHEKKKKSRKEKTMSKKNNDEKRVLNEELNKTNMGQAVNMIREVIGDSNDPVVKAIDKYGKYVPLVAGFLQGFLDRAKQHQEVSASQEPKIQAPPGWNTMSPIQRLQRKYLPNGQESDWYKQGVLYDSMVGGGEFAGVSNAPVEMQRTIKGSQEAAYSNMADLQRASQADVGTVVDNDVPVVPRKDGQPEKIEDCIKKDSEDESGRKPVVREERESGEKPVLPSDSLDNDVKDGIVNQVIGETMNYMNIVVSYFKNRPMEQFKEDVANAETTINNFMNGIGRFLPYQIKDVIHSTSFEQLVELVKREAPEKITYLEENSLLPQFEQLWKGIQDKVIGKK